jgi:hypothetical protein
MKKYLFSIGLAIALMFTNGCSKECPVEANPLASLNGNWKNTLWGGVANNEIVIKIDQTSKTGVIQSIGAKTFNFAPNETIFSNITATGDKTVFTCGAIFKYGNGNQSIANTTATISLQNSNAQILVRYAAAQGIQPPDYIYTKF